MNLILFCIILLFFIYSFLIYRYFKFLKILHYGKFASAATNIYFIYVEWHAYFWKIEFFIYIYFLYNYIMYNNLFI